MHPFSDNASHDREVIRIAVLLPDSNSIVKTSFPLVLKTQGRRKRRKEAPPSSPRKRPIPKGERNTRGRSQTQFRVGRPHSHISISHRRRQSFFLFDNNIHRKGATRRRPSLSPSSLVFEATIARHPPRRDSRSPPHQHERLARMRDCPSHSSLFLRV